MIQALHWTTKQSLATLGALRSIATLHGKIPLTPKEHELIEGVRINILAHQEILDRSENPHTSIHDVVTVIKDSEHKKHAAQLFALMPYASFPYSDEKRKISEKYLEALNEQMHLVEDFVKARKKHNLHMEYCALRKLGRDVFPFQDPDGKHREVLKLFKDARAF